MLMVGIRGLRVLLTLSLSLKFAMKLKHIKMETERILRECEAQEMYRIMTIADEGADSVLAAYGIDTSAEAKDEFKNIEIGELHAMLCQAYEMGYCRDKKEILERNEESPATLFVREFMQKRNLGVCHPYDDIDLTEMEFIDHMKEAFKSGIYFGSHMTT